jgi:hypothetical protein
MKLAIVLALLATPALADTSLPPAKYDIAPGATTVEEIEQMELAYFGWKVPLKVVPYGAAIYSCDVLSLTRFGTPYPRSELAGGVLMGCLIRNHDNSDPAIVISYDPSRPGLDAQLLRHELGHLNGWPGDHRRD